LFKEVCSQRWASTLANKLTLTLIKTAFQFKLKRKNYLDWGTFTTFLLI
jgi:hypothetical protein